MVALGAIGCMFLSNGLIIGARKMAKKPVRLLLSLLAYTGLVVAFFLMLAVLFTF